MTANPRNPALSDIGDGAMPEGMEGLLKQLVWEDVDEICTRCVAPVFGGKMIVVEISPGSGEYSAGIDLGGLCFRLIQDAYDDNGFRYSAPKNFGSIDAAKAAAQADYTARVLSAVDPDEITRLRAALTARDERMRAEGAEAADEEAFARGANWAQEKARVEGRLVIVDSPELATLRAALAEAQAKIARLTNVLKKYKDDFCEGFCMDCPWGYVDEDMIRDCSGCLARAALQENANE